ncbi:MAG: anti-sigma factor [Alphaproteobacteria bacterium]|jgi:anti-sigma-K factor RskA|nr:anti-sigma factor [Alphaproteobacteria bacterium]
MDKDQDGRDREQRDDIMAAEFVLGVLSTDEHATCARRVEQDDSFRNKVDQWSRDLAPIADELTPIGPPERVRAHLKDHLFKDKAPASHKGFLAQIWGQAGLWRGLAAVAVLTALGLGYEMDRRTGELNGTVEALQTDLTNAQATFASLDQAVQAARDDAQVADATMQELLNRTSGVLTGTLASSDSPVVYRALYWSDTASLILVGAGQSAPVGRDFELWLIEDGRPPLSLGTIPRDGHGAFALPESVDRTVVLQGAFTISVEPLGGSADGEPSGPMVAAGKLIHTP